MLLLLLKIVYYSLHIHIQISFNNFAENHQNNYNYYINYYNYLILNQNSKLELYVYKTSGAAVIPTKGHSHSPCPQKNVHSFCLE